MVGGALYAKVEHAAELKLVEDGWHDVASGLEGIIKQCCGSSSIDRLSLLACLPPAEQRPSTLLPLPAGRLDSTPSNLPSSLLSSLHHHRPRSATTPSQQDGSHSLKA